ncbi:hypothetical protein D9M70_362900 [compost metagenome]
MNTLLKCKTVLGSALLLGLLGLHAPASLAGESQDKAKQPPAANSQIAPGKHDNAGMMGHDGMNHGTMHDGNMNHDGMMHGDMDHGAMMQGHDKDKSSADSKRDQ